MTQFTKTCLIYQQDKVERTKIAALLEPLPILSHPWESVSFDFLMHLSKVGEFESILVIVDRISQYVIFVPTPKLCSTETTIQLVFQNVVKLWGIPTSIVRNRDGRFTGPFGPSYLSYWGRA